MFKPVNYGRLVCRIRSEESCVRIGGGGGGGGPKNLKGGGGGGGGGGGELAERP